MDLEGRTWLLFRVYRATKQLSAQPALVCSKNR
jgi:hypothetical protein